MVSKIKLITRTFTTDSIGQSIPMPITTDVIADVSSISQSEFMQAGQIGLKPEYQFRIWEKEYGGQRQLEYEDKVYSVYRTYRAKDGRVELYTEERIGENDT